MEKYCERYKIAMTETNHIYCEEPHAFTIRNGDAWEFEMEVTDDDDQPFDFSAVDLEMVVKRRKEDQQPERTYSKANGFSVDATQHNLVRFRVISDLPKGSFVYTIRALFQPDPLSILAGPVYSEL